MDTTPRTIDLGVYSHQAGPERPPHPERPWLTRTRLVRWWRWAAAVLVAVVVLPLAGAAPAPAPGLVPLWTVPGGPYDGQGVAAGETALYAVSRVRGEQILTAYRLADGSVDWSAPLAAGSGRAPQYEVAVLDGVPVVYSFHRFGHATAYDPESTQVRWTSQGFPDYVEGGMVGLAIPEQDSGEGLQFSLEIRDFRSGTVAVTFDDGDDRRWLFYMLGSGGRVRAFGLAEDGRMTSYDVATGAAMETVETGFEVGPAGGRPGSVSVVGGLVVVAGEIGVEDVVVAYDSATLERLWRVEAPSRVMACGPVVCAGGAEEPLRGIDPQTGVVRWTATCAPLGMPDQCVLDAREIGPGDRLALRPFPAGRDYPVREVVVDAATGRPVTAPSRWQVAAWQESSLLLSRGEGGTAEGMDHRVWWARSDPDLERIEVLGAIEAASCQPRQPYLLCSAPDGKVEVWRIEEE